jgi:capsular exopolysaccharide synthesis family protein
LLVTSANPQEGKTVTVLNLALSFAMLPDFKVLVIDGDMRRGTLGNWLGVSDEQVGLSNLIDGSALPEEVILQSAAIPMHFMVRGNSQVSDMHSSQLKQHIQKASEKYNLILVDSPPVNLLADVQVLAASSDAVLLITRAFKTTRKTLEKAVENLAPFRLIGTVLNAGMAPRRNGYYGYYGY